MGHAAFQIFRRVAASACRLRSDERGVVIILFAAALPVVLTLFLMVVDHTRAMTERTNLQNALDAATLYVAKSNLTDNAQIQSLGLKILNANLQASGSGPASQATFSLSSDARVTGTAYVDLPVTISSFVQRSSLTVGSTSEVARSSNNLEVSLVLDLSGSMEGQKLTDLKSAAKSLVDIVVKDVQTPHYSKVAIVPYSNAVNVGSYASQVRGTVTNGSARTPGSQQYEFRRASNNAYTTHSISTCVTERAGAEAYTDAPPSTARLGRNYPPPSNANPANPCPSSVISPLSSNRASVKSSIDALAAGGSTGGHIGVAWGWYLVSPNFGYLWPSASAPAAYGTRELLKVAVIMTDGEYNSVYYNGVIAKDSSSGSGSNQYHINENSHNGNSYSQAQQLCTNMKAKGVIVYTVGLDIIDKQAARDLVNNCASSAGHVYLPSGGTALKDAFKAIAQDINSLRISR